MVHQCRKSGFVKVTDIIMCGEERKGLQSSVSLTNKRAPDRNLFATDNIIILSNEYLFVLDLYHESNNRPNATVRLHLKL